MNKHIELIQNMKKWLPDNEYIIGPLFKKSCFKVIEFETDKEYLIFYGDVDSVDYGKLHEICVKIKSGEGDNNERYEF